MFVCLLTYLFVYLGGGRGLQVNVVQSLLRAILALRPLPPLPVDLLGALAVGFNAWHTVIPAFEHQVGSRFWFGFGGVIHFRPKVLRFRQKSCILMGRVFSSFSAAAFILTASFMLVIDYDPVNRFVFGKEFTTSPTELLYFRQILVHFDK